jgi:hypothetical protein
MAAPPEGKGRKPPSPPPPLVVPDPAVAGPYAVDVAEYDGGPTVLVDPKGIAYPGEIHGVAHYPTTGVGPFPLIVFLHGNHSTCEYGGAELVGYPCPSTPVSGPVLNYRGYDYLGQNLASHGYVTVSIDANAVNTYNVAGDKGANERAQLIARTLDLFAAFNEGTAIDIEGDIGSALEHRLDLTRIGMMGHSRGGEGVSLFITYNETRTDGPTYLVKAVLALAGTDYNLPRTSGVHFGTLLPLCDGDVYDLQAGFAYDRHRFDPQAANFERVQFTVAGTNHNFYNTTWVGDDFSTSPTAGKCSSTAVGSVRLSADDTRRVGLALVNGFMRRYVGDETSFAPLMTGAAALPASACPGGVAPCPGLVGTSYLAPLARRRLLAPVAVGDPTTATSDGGAIAVTGAGALSFCDPQPDDGVDGKNRDAGTESTCPSNPYRSRARALTLEWTGPSVMSVAMGVGGGSVSHFDALTFRAATNFGTASAEGPTPVDLEIALVDGAGRVGVVTASSRSTALVPMLSDSARKLTMNGIAIPLAAFAAQGVDLSSITRIELRPLGPSGSMQLTELGFQSGVFQPASGGGGKPPKPPKDPRSAT